MKVLQTFALPLGYHANKHGAVDETRTRDLHLGKVALYQLSYYRTWCLGAESNHRHADFQSAALPAELPRHLATWKGLEPSTSSVTGWHSNQLNYQAAYGGNNRARTCDPLLVRQVLSQLSYAPTGFPAPAALAATFDIISHRCPFVKGKARNSHEFFRFCPGGQLLPPQTGQHIHGKVHRPARRTGVSKPTRRVPRPVWPYCPGVRQRTRRRSRNIRPMRT